MKAINSTLFIVLFSCLICAAANAQSSRSIELTLLSDSRSGGADQQQWLAAMSKVGADRIRVETVGRPRPSVEENEAGGVKLVSVETVGRPRPSRRE